MALGGIPVSGGITGNGTLISTNLLQSPLLWATTGFWQPAFTLGGTAGAAGYEAAFIKDGDPKTLYKTAASDAEMTLTMVLDAAPPPDVYGVVIVGHNLVAASMTTAKFEGGNGNYTDITEDLIINVATLTPAYKLLSAVASGMDRWRLRIQFSSSIALQIGEVFLIGAPPLAFARNFDWEGSLAEELGQVTSDGISGVPRKRTRWVRYWREFDFTQLTQAQYDALVVAARNGQVIFSPEGSEGCAYYGVLDLRPAKDQKANQYGVAAAFTEAAK